MSHTVVAIRHVAFEDLGVLAPVLADHGYRLTYLDAGVDPLDQVADADLAVILGGPVGVYDTDQYPFLAAELDVIGARMRGDRPTLGICLGAQLMAKALGAGVGASGGVEIGYAPITLTAAGRASVLGPLDDAYVLHWHADQFEIPPGADHLAETRDFPHQAFALGRRILGLQFHLEAEATQIERWLVGHAHQLAAAGIDPARIRADARTYGPGLAVLAAAVGDAWLTGLNC